MFTRAVVFILALLGFALSGALIVREAALAGGDRVEWGVPEWWHETIGEGAWQRAGVTGVVVLALVVLCLVLAVRVVVPRGGDGGGDGRALELGERDAGVKVPLAVLERMMAIVLVSRLGEGGVRRVRVTRRGQRLVTRTRLTAAATDLVALHRRALAMARRDLGGATGLEVERLVLEIDRLVPPAQEGR